MSRTLRDTRSIQLLGMSGNRLSLASFEAKGVNVDDHGERVRQEEGIGRREEGGRGMERGGGRGRERRKKKCV